MLKKILCSLLIAALLATTSICVPVSAAPDYQYIINTECSYILSHQLSDGALVMSDHLYPGGYRICPYFSNIAARALLENPTTANISAVKNYMLWYFSHLNADGSIYDYYASNYSGNATVASSGSYDSIDSYAATFLSLCRRLCEVSPADTSWLRGYSYYMELVGNALYSIVDDGNHYFPQYASETNDGLTVAKPQFQVKYTMDNSESCKGLYDMIWLQNYVSYYNNPTYYTNLWWACLNSIENHLWLPSYNMYVMFYGGPVPQWSTFYADATCQLYPIWNGVISPSSSRAYLLWSQFNNYYGNWCWGQVYDSGGFPWTVVCYTAALVGDTVRVDNYLNYLTYCLNQGSHPNNWYNLEAAFVILAAKKVSG